MSVTPKRPLPNPEDPVIAPGQAVKFLDFLTDGRVQTSPRMLSHYVKTTIGETAKPADGRGTTRTFSVKDVVVMATTVRLSTDLGLSPVKVRAAGEIIATHAWPKVFPDDFRPFLDDSGRWTTKPGTRNLFLIGFWLMPDEFRFKLAGSEVTPGVVTSPNGGPSVVYDVGLSLTSAALYVLQNICGIR
jgi:hypothetical protein